MLIIIFHNFQWIFDIYWKIYFIFSFNMNYPKPTILTGSRIWKNSPLQDNLCYKVQKSLYYLNICWQVLWSWFVQEPGVTNARQIEPDRKSQQLFCGQIFWAPPYLSLLCWPTNPLLSLDQVGIYLFLCLSFSLSISVSFCLAVCLFLSFFLSWYSLLCISSSF